jgi:hypothetical protein
MGSVRQRPLTLEQINDLPDNEPVATLYIRVIKKQDKFKKSWFTKFLK